MARIFQNLLVICLVLGSFSWAGWDGIDPEADKAIQNLLQKAGSEGHSRELLERKIQEGLSKGKSSGEIIKALEARILVLQEISKEGPGGKKDIASALLKKELAGKGNVEKASKPSLKPEAGEKPNKKINKKSKPKLVAKEETKVKGLSKQDDKKKGKGRIKKGLSQNAPSSKDEKQAKKTLEADSKNPKKQEDFESKSAQKAKKQQDKMDKQLKGLEKKLESKEKALEKKQKKMSEM